MFRSSPICGLLSITPISGAARMKDARAVRTKDIRRLRPLPHQWTRRVLARFEPNWLGGGATGRCAAHLVERSIRPIAFRDRSFSISGRWIAERDVRADSVTIVPASCRSLVDMAGEAKSISFSNSSRSRPLNLSMKGILHCLRTAGSI
jgi:hypothetical protein